MNDDPRSVGPTRTPPFPPLHPASLRAAWWAWRAVRAARRDLRDQGIGARVGAPPAVPWAARTGVNAVLRHLEPTCLERAVVEQTWLAAHGHRVDVVIGVRSGSDGTRAHAWLDGVAEDHEHAAYREIHRIRVPAP